MRLFSDSGLFLQSIIPGILYGDKTAALKYGSVDNGQNIKFNDKFHDKVARNYAKLGIPGHPAFPSVLAIACDLSSGF